MIGQCEVKKCRGKAKYALNKTFLSGEKRWLHVCDKHEHEIAKENFSLTGGHILTKSKM